MSTPITFTAYAVNNLCYKANCKMPSGSPAGEVTVTGVRRNAAIGKIWGKLDELTAALIVANGEI